MSENTQTATAARPGPGVWADRAILALIAIGLIAFALHNVVAYDVWWQIRTGELIRASGWPATDPFSYGFPGREWIELRWLYCVVISLIYDHAGLNYLIGAKILWLLGVGGVIYAIGRRQFAWAVNLALFAAVMVMHQRFVLRPELVSYGMIAIVLLLIRRYQAGKELYWLYPLPLIQVLWVNSHTLYAIGPVIVWIFTAAEFAAGLLPAKFPLRPSSVMDKRSLLPLAAAASAMTLACLVNPYGIKGALLAIQLFAEIQSTHVLNDLISELRSPFAAAGLNLLFVSYIGLLVLSAAGFVLRWREIPYGWLALWAAFAYLSFTAERNLPVFAIVASATIIINFGGMRPASHFVWAARALCGITLLVTIPLVVTNYYHRQRDPDRRFGTGVAVRRIPAGAMEFVKSAELPRPVITNIGESSYVLFDQGPASVFIDGRLEIYGGDNVEAGMAALGSVDELTSTTERLNVFTFITRHASDTALVGALIRDPRWEAVYFDESHIVFVRSAPSTEQLISRFRIDWNTAEPSRAVIPATIAASNLFDGIVPTVADDTAEQALGRLYLAAGNTQKGQQYLERAVALWPDDPLACLPLGILYRSQRREAEAAQLLARVPAASLDSRNVQAQAATMYEQADNPAAAADAWLKVIASGDQSTEVYQHLAESAIKSQRWDAAYSALSELSKRSPGDIKLLNNLGAVAEKSGHRQVAVDAFTRSLRITPSQPDALTQLGVIKARGGDISGAKASFEQALAIDPNYEQARRGLEMLNQR